MRVQAPPKLPFSNSALATSSASPTPNDASLSAPWNFHLRELAKRRHFAEALSLFRRMLRSGQTPNAFTFPFVLKSCASLALSSIGDSVHCHVIKSGWAPQPFVQTALVSMYCRRSTVEIARKVFDGNPESKSSTVCYNALISGLVSNSRFIESVALFGRMRETGVSVGPVTVLGLMPGCDDPRFVSLGMNLHGFCLKSGISVSDDSVRNCLVTMYVKCGAIEKARNLFDEIPEKGLITYNAMISGYAQNGFAGEALELYREMNGARVFPDPVTLVGILSSCAHLGAVVIGREVEKRIRDLGFGSNLFLKNSLVNMYARCGDLAKAREIFDSMEDRTVISWTAIIGGYGLHGHGDISIKLFEDMISTGIRPDGTVFVAVLHACSHSGLTDKGMDYFALMQKRYDLKPGPEHYSCVVDLLGRAGRLGEAERIIGSMKIRSDGDGAIWGALLNACRIHKNVDLAESAFEKVVELEPKNIGYYVLMSNIYNDVNNPEGVLKIRAMMRERRLKKEPGISYVEFRGKVNAFLAGDKTHPQTEEIYGTLRELESLLKGLGLKTKEELRGEGVHSEKLAIAFGLLNSDSGTEIVVMKNLRACEDCHLFLKLVSKVVDRKFVVRDATRFHHFKDGFCSCNDYW